MLSKERYAELEQNGIDRYYDRIATFILDAHLPKGMNLSVYPIYSKDEQNGVTEQEQRERAGREDAVYTGLLTALQTDSIPASSWQVLMQTNRDELPTRICASPIPMLPIGELPEDSKPTEDAAAADALRQAELVSDRIDLPNEQDGITARNTIWGTYCQLKYDRLYFSDEIIDLIGESSRARAEHAAKERDAKLIQAAAKYTTGSASSLIKKDIAPVPWLWNGILQKQGTAILAGESKVGKSWLALAIGLHAARGEKYLNWDMNKTDVLYLALDGMNEQRMKERITEITGEDAPDNFRYYIPESGVPFPRIDETPGTFDVIKGIMLRDKQELGLNYGLIIIDLFSDVLPLQARTNDAYRQGRAEMNPFNAFARETKSMVMTITHFGKKKDESNPYNSIVGSVAMFSAADAGLLLYRKTLKDKDITLTVNGRDQIQDSYVLRGRTTFDYIGTTEDAARTYDEELYIGHPIRAAILELVNNAGGRIEGTAPQIKTAYETTTGKALAYSKIDIGRFLSKHEEKLREIDGIKFAQDRNRSYIITKC